MYEINMKIIAYWILNRLKNTFSTINTLVTTTTMSSPRLVVNTASGKGQSSSSLFSRSSDRFLEDRFIGDVACSSSSPGSVYRCHFCTCCFLLCNLCSENILKRSMIILFRNEWIRHHRIYEYNPTVLNIFSLRWRRPR